MGFLPEIERSKQQQIQQQNKRELALKAQAEIDIQTAAEWQNNVQINAERIEGDAISFIKDCSTVTSLFDQMNKFGYEGYFEKVSEISGFNLEKIFYIKYPLKPSANPEIVKQQLDAEEKLKNTSSKFGWWEFGWSDLSKKKGIKGEETKHPGVVFFGDKVTTVEEKKLTEPEEVGIGIRFLKQEVRIDQHRNRLAEWVKVGYKSPTERWHHVVYVRIDPQSKATITGFTQRQVDLKDLRLFDEVLEQAIHNPAIIHTTRMERWDPPRRWSYNDPTYSSGEQN